MIQLIVTTIKNLENLKVLPTAMHASHSAKKSCHSPKECDNEFLLTIKGLTKGMASTKQQNFPSIFGFKSGTIKNEFIFTFSVDHGNFYVSS